MPSQTTTDRCNEIDRAIVGLRLKRGALDLEEAELLVAARRARVHEALGFASFVAYLENRLGYPGRLAMDRIRVADALTGLPALRAALASGARSWTAVRELVRVVTPETEAEWIGATEGRTVRTIERMVSARARGDRPSDDPRPNLQKRVVRFELTADAFARFKEAADKVRAEVDATLSDADVLGVLVDRAFAGPADDAGPAHRVTVGVCVQCTRTWQRAAGEWIEVDRQVGERARCDGEIVAVSLDRPLGETHACSEVPSPRSVLQALTAAEADRGASDAEAPTHVGRAARDGHAPTPVGPDLAAIAHGWTAHLAQLGRTRCTVTPKHREAIIERDGGTCSVPDCRNHRHLDVHHLDPQGGGGGHDPDNLVCLCSTHHRLHHEGRLRIEGRPSTGLRFFHADGRPYGALPHPMTRSQDVREAREAREDLDIGASVAREKMPAGAGPYHRRWFSGDAITGPGRAPVYGFARRAGSAGTMRVRAGFA